MKGKLLERSEDDECIALVGYLDILKRQKKIITYAHIPNETYTPSWKQKNKNKALGVATGFPDYIIVAPGKTIFIEMKRAYGGVVSFEQEFWLATLEGQPNVIASVCRGFREAEVFLRENL